MAGSLKRFRMARFAIFVLVIVLSLVTDVAPEPAERIVGGQPASSKNFPYQVAIRLRGPRSQIECGGTILDPLYVLTAAHCFYMNPGDYALPLAGNAAVWVMYGNADSRVASRVRAAHLWVRQGYEIGEHKNDVALLKLQKPIRFSSNVSSIRLSPDNTPLRSGADLTISGWGLTTEMGNLSRKLLSTTVDYLVGACESKYTALGYSPVEHMCAGCIDGGHDTCQGDSGGPLSIRSVSRGCPIQVGITAFGTGCARRFYPTAYTRVSRHIQWLESVVKRPLRSTVGVDPSSDCDACRRRTSSSCSGSGTRFDQSRCNVEVQLAAAFKLSLLSRCASSTGKTRLSAFFSPPNVAVGNSVSGGVKMGKVYLLRSARGLGKDAVMINAFSINTPLRAPISVVAMANFSAMTHSWPFAVSGCTTRGRDNYTYAALYKSPGNLGAYYQISLPVN